MFDFPSFTPNRPQKIVHEGSSQQSPRESEGIWQQWKHANEVQKQVYTISDQAKATHRALIALQPKQWGGLDFHPFKIYQYPNALINGDSDWKNVRVRAGEVLTNIISPATSSAVQGTDGVLFCDNQIYPAFDGTGGVGPSGSLDIPVDANCAHYWFWIETSGSTSSPTYHLRHGADPTVASYGNPNPWDTFPVPSGDKVVIGFADSLTGASTGQLYIRQYLRTDVMSQGALVQVNLCNEITGENEVYYFVGFKSGSI